MKKNKKKKQNKIKRQRKKERRNSLRQVGLFLEGFLFVFSIYFTQQTLKSEPSLMFNSSKSFASKQIQNHNSLKVAFSTEKTNRETPLATPQIKTQPIMLHNIENKIYSKTLLELYKTEEVTFLVIQHMTNLQQCKNPNSENINPNSIKFD